MWLKDRKYLFVVRDRLTLEKTLVDLIDLPYSVQGEVSDFINFLGKSTLCFQFFNECFTTTDKFSTDFKIFLDVS